MSGMPSIHGLEITGYHPQPDGTALIEWTCPVATQNAISEFCIKENLSIEDFLALLMEIGLRAANEEDLTPRPT